MFLQQRRARTTTEPHKSSREPPSPRSGQSRALRHRQRVQLNHQPNPNTINIPKRLRKGVLSKRTLPNARSHGPDTWRTLLTLLPSPRPELRAATEAAPHVASVLSGDAPPQTGMPVASSQKEAGEAQETIWRNVRRPGFDETVLAGRRDRGEPLREEEREGGETGEGG